MNADAVRAWWETNHPVIVAWDRDEERLMVVDGDLGGFTGVDAWMFAHLPDADADDIREVTAQLGAENRRDATLLAAEEAFHGVGIRDHRQDVPA